MDYVSTFGAFLIGLALGIVGTIRLMQQDRLERNEITVRASLLGWVLADYVLRVPKKEHLAPQVDLLISQLEDHKQERRERRLEGVSNGHQA